MNGKRESAAAQILKAIDFGLLPTDEMDRRLMDLIMKEADRTDGPADEELILTCLDLMDVLQGRGHEVDMVRINALNQRIANAIQKMKKREKRRRTAFRAIGAIAAALVLIVALGVPLRWTWFESWSTPDEQQYVIMGHEITVEMVASAIAENEAKEPITFSGCSEFEKHLGFDPQIPSVLCGKWIANYGVIQYYSGYIQIVTRYVDAENPEISIICTVCYFTDAEYAYLAFEQNAEGKKVSLGSTEVYLSDNIDRNSATWYNKNMYAQIAGHIASEEAIELLKTLIGEHHE